MRQLVGLILDESGTTAVEYSVMLGFIIAVLVGSVAAFGNTENGAWLGIWNTMSAHGM